MKRVVLLGFLLAIASPAFGQHSHGNKGPNGGQMEDVAGVHLELLTKGQALTLNVFDEKNKPISTKGYTASALVTAGGDKETVSLTPHGENALQGDLKKAIGGGATISVTLKTSEGKSGQARFKQ